MLIVPVVRPEVPPISRGYPIREKKLAAGLGEAFSLDIPLHRAFFRSPNQATLSDAALSADMPAGASVATASLPPDWPAEAIAPPHLAAKFAQQSAAAGGFSLRPRQTAACKAQ